jgi:polysaccharide export outer membrane protein
MRVSPVLILIFFCCFTSCVRTPAQFCVEGAQEFVIDSYKIRQGKQAILELQGIDICDLPCDAMCEYVDFVYEDDILNITIYHPCRRDLVETIRFINETVGFRVVDGYINVPDIPLVFVRGLTLDDARDAIQSAFLEQIDDVEVFISYKDRLSRKVDLIGHVGLSTIPVDGKIRLFEVLSRAHVPPHANLFSSYLVRDGMQLPIDFYKLIREGDYCQNIVMRGGDRIFIADPMDAKVMVMGEVLMPKPVPLPFGFMSLREALVSAGGIPFTGNRNCIQVIRGNMICPKIYQLSWEQIIHLPNDSLLLMPGDTVYVSETPITQWNRFISQLLPSLGGVQTAGEMYKSFAF